MKPFVFCTLLLAAVVPALAIDQGACCAKVGGACISTCKRPGGCTGSGDCA